MSLGAKSRDSDATRMQARKVAFPSNQSDSLTPPDDTVDWRYFKLAKAGRVTIIATFDSADAGAEIVLTGATGHEIASAKADGANAKLAQRLEPGVYYVSVQARAQTSYSLSLR